MWFRLSTPVVMALTVALLSVGSAVAAPAVPTGVTASAQTAPIQPPLQVDGTVLRDQTGRRVGLKGVAVQMVPYYAGATPTTQQAFLVQVTQRNFGQRGAEFAKIRSLGYDAIRVHIPAPDVYNSELYESRSATVARITAIVASAKAAGLITILDANATGDTMANWRDYEPLFAEIIARIGNDPWVIWEPFNEPADYSPGAPTYLAAVKGIGAYLRSLGSLQPLILPSNGYEQDVEPQLMANILGDAAAHRWRAAGLLFGVHPYLDQYVGNPGNFGDTFTGAAFDALQHGIAANLASYPLIVTEMGRYNNGITTTSATLAAYQWVAGLGAAGLNGLIAWDWDWALRENASDANAWTWDGLHLNPWGQQSNDVALSRMTFPELSSLSKVNTPAPKTITASAPIASSAKVVAPKAQRAHVIRGMLQVVFQTPITYVGRIQLTVLTTSLHRVVRASKTVPLLTGRRIIKWRLPSNIARVRFFALRATYAVPGHVCGTAVCWRTLAHWRVRGRTPDGRGSRHRWRSATA